MKVTIESHSKSSGRKDNRGFSLVELIIVIAVMAILIGILAPQFIKYVEKSREATDIQNIDNLKRAAEAYVVDTLSNGGGSNFISKNCIDLLVDNTDGVIFVYLADEMLDSTILKEYGIPEEIDLKSKKWKAGVDGYEGYDGFFLSFDLGGYNWVYQSLDGIEYTGGVVPHADYYYIDGRPYDGED